ncbi:hypothetical protein D9Q98_010204 [Chlorella vulgaris]|uniref:Bifunctional inhibitor/plant lipid transfer protein/seed storage helical domain-containing protein n=1 Tax=Chlorella vulgaris TaxID=3077 RepID=A0A9D4YWG7_CHLVU|nr:hypothetical protein D9Q98_010204 [Chlorella vulgaris]
MQRSALPLVLLAACLCPVLARPASAAGRRLTQDGVDGATPPTADGSGQSQFGSAAVDTCVQLTNSAGQACSVESDTISLVYSRSSEALPTQQEAEAAITNMKSAAQPSTSCCSAFQPFTDARCPCDADFQQLLPIGGFSPLYFEGATAILAAACGLDFPPCQPGEKINLAATGLTG